jgi:hypothetical protein
MKKLRLSIGVVILAATLPWSVRAQSLTDIGSGNPVPSTNGGPNYFTGNPVPHVTTATAGIQDSSTVRVRENFDLGWRFFQGDVTNADQPAFADHDWKNVSLPHDWSIAGPYNQTNSIDARGGFLPTGMAGIAKLFLRQSRCAVKKSPWSLTVSIATAMSGSTASTLAIIRSAISVSSMT